MSNYRGGIKPIYLLKKVRKRDDISGQGSFFSTGQIDGTKDAHSEKGSFFPYSGTVSFKLITLCIYLGSGRGERYFTVDEREKE